MRIAYDASSIRRNRSGVGYYTSSLLEALSAQFPSCKILLLSHLHQKAISAENIRFTQKHSFAVKEIWMQAWVPRIVARIRPDMCHFTNGIAPLAITTPYVVTVHDLSLIRHPEWHPFSRRLWMARALKPSILAASAVVCVSEATRKDLLDWLPVPESKIHVIPLAARDAFTFKTSLSERELVVTRYGLTRPFILYVGNIEPRKNLSVLIRAFRSLDLPNVDLVLAGRRAWLWESTIDEARRAGKCGRVHCLNYVPETDLPALYQSALAFAYPSRMEGFGLPVLEAMASGTPVVASMIDPLTSLVGDTGWLVPPEDISGWHEALLEVVTQKEKRSFLASKAKERAMQYSWRRTAQETMRCYQSLLARQGLEHYDPPASFYRKGYLRHAGS